MATYLERQELVLGLSLDLDFVFELTVLSEVA